MSGKSLVLFYSSPILLSICVTFWEPSCWKYWIATSLGNMFLSFRTWIYWPETPPNFDWLSKYFGIFHVGNQWIERIKWVDIWVSFPFSCKILSLSDSIKILVSMRVISWVQSCGQEICRRHTYNKHTKKVVYCQILWLTNLIHITKKFWKRNKTFLTLCVPKSNKGSEQK